MTGTCMDMLASTELVEAAVVEDARLGWILEVEASSSEDVALVDGRDDAVDIGVSARSEGLSSWRRAADWGIAVTVCRQSRSTIHTR